MQCHFLLRSQLPVKGGRWSGFVCKMTAHWLGSYLLVLLGLLFNFTTSNFIFSKVITLQLVISDKFWLIQHSTTNKMFKKLFYIKESHAPYFSTSIYIFLPFSEFHNLNIHQYVPLSKFYNVIDYNQNYGLKVVVTVICMKKRRDKNHLP